jgi:nitrite reductase/ring-hydroxylating ferredoxin subunit
LNIDCSACTVSPVNAGWWPLAFAEELKGDPVASQLGGTSVVLFRDDSQCARALENRCPHRRTPLSMGAVTEDGLIECCYHGWAFAGDDGRCVRIPHLAPEERVPPRFGAGAFPTQERDGFIWVWSGDPADADPNDVPRSDTHGRSSRRTTAVLKMDHRALLAALVDDAAATLGLRSVVDGTSPRVDTDADGALASATWELGGGSARVVASVGIVPIDRDSVQVRIRTSWWARSGARRLALATRVRARRPGRPFGPVGARAR